MFSALDDLPEGQISKKVTKTNPKVEEKKKVEKKEEKKVLEEKPKEKTQQKVVSQPKTSQDGDGFEEVHKSTRGGRPQQTTRGQSTRGGRGGVRGGRGNSKPFVPRVDSNTGTENVVHKDNRDHKTEKSERKDHQVQGELKKGGRGRYHDHHLSGTGTRGGFKKRGAGGNNWGTQKDDLESQTETHNETDHKEDKSDQNTEKKVEVVDPLKEKKDARKKRKDDEKKARKGKGLKTEEKKDDQLSVDLVKSKVDPNAKTLEQYQKEQEEKKRKTLGSTVPTEKKEEKKEEKKDEKKPTISKDDLFKTSEKSPSKSAEKKKPTKSTHVPNVADKGSFPSLK